MSQHLAIKISAVLVNTQIHTDRQFLTQL